jgi:ribosomal protein L37E
MADPPARQHDQHDPEISRLTGTRKTTDAGADAARVLCDRCGAETYRMHAVWRCPACGFKTDCCGW